MGRISVLAFLLGCGAPAEPVLGETTAVVPGGSMPAEVAIQTANNNLDVVRHEGRVHFAFRTAPSHFASKLATLYVVSSDDEQTWRYEAAFNRMTDLREPRFLSHEGRLFLYFAVLGESALDFEPQGMMVSERSSEGVWSEPEWIYLPGFIPWRAKVVGGKVYLTAYAGGENIYDDTMEPTEIHFLTTTDGRSFTPVAGDSARVEGGGGSETDFVLRDDGSLIAVIRNEAGDDLGWGSKICRAEAGALDRWTCVGDRRKYDSPLLFRHCDDIWLIARRNLNEYNGLYQISGMEDASHRDRTLYYQLDYSGHAKRCALWKIDPELLAAEHVLDLPSKGDTCFPGIVELEEDEFAVYNYSSPADGPDVTWLEGQLAPTLIYRSELRFR